MEWRTRPLRWQFQAAMLSWPASRRRAERFLPGGKAMKKDHEKPLPGSADAAASPSLSRRRFLKVSMTGAALAGAAGLSACVAPSEMRTAGTTPKPVALYQDFPN